MAKLNKGMQKQVGDAQDGFALMPDMVVHARLRDVDASREGPKGPYWSWEYEIVEGEHKGRRQWNNTSLSAAAAFSFQQTYKAFGVPLDTDTDDMIGMVVRLQIGHRTIQSGPREGEPTNQIERVLPKLPDFVVPEDDMSGQPGQRATSADPEEAIF